MSRPFWFPRRQRSHEQDLERELRAHLDLEAEEQQARGLSARDAWFATRRAFGNIALIQEEVRSLRPWTCWEFLLRDLQFASRALRKTPWFFLLSILTLALGIGANTAMFSVLDTVLLRPLSYPHADRLVRIRQSEPKLGETGLGTAPPEFTSYRDRTRAFSSLAGYQIEGYDLTGDGVPEHLVVCRATASRFATLQVAPMLGQVFTTEEERPGAGRVAVLSYSYWQRRYGGDKGAVGRTIRLNERPYRIIGVMPPGFSFPSTLATPGEPPLYGCRSSSAARNWASGPAATTPGLLRACGMASRSSRLATTPSAWPRNSSASAATFIPATISSRRRPKLGNRGIRTAMNICLPRSLCWLGRSA